MQLILTPPMRDFSGGLNNKDDANLIADNQLADVNNAILGRGFVEKRYGYIKYNNAALTNPVTKIYDFYKNDGTKELLSLSGSKLYKDVSGTLTQIPFNVITSLSSTDAQMLTYKDRSVSDVVLLADGGKLKVYNGTNVSEVTPHTATTDEATDPGSNDLVNLTTFRAIAIKKDRIFAAAHPTVKNRVSFCHHDQTLGWAVYDYWPATFFFDVAADENDSITALKVFRDTLVIFCNRSVWLLKGDGRTLQDYDLSKLNVPNGCIAPKSVATVGNALFYLSNDHIYALSSTDFSYVSAQIVSRNIEKTLKSISIEDKQKAVGTFFDNKYYLSFPDGTCLIYDTLLTCWYKWSNVKANSFLDRDGVLFFGSDNGYIYKFDENTWNDDGTAISFSMTTKTFDFDMPVQIKKVKKLWVIAKQFDVLSSTFNLQATIDYVNVDLNNISTDDSLVWDEGNWDEATWDFKDIVKKLIKIRAQGNNIQWVISNNELDQPLTIYGFVMQYTVKPPK